MASRVLASLRSAATVVLLAAAGAACLAAPAHAQTYLPSVKIGTAALISPTAAASHYGAGTTSTTTGPGAPASLPPELVELARALKNDPDLIYDYVRNNIETTWIYGVQKGALGTEIDKSGTPFDQAMLMVALLRQAGYSASYLTGTVTIGGAQFTGWTGVTDARAACQLLAAGAIPGSVNGTTGTACSGVATGAITQVQMAHIWVSVTLGGTAYAFDPSDKPHVWKTGIANLAATAGLTAGQPLDQATGIASGMDSGALVSGTVPYVHNVNQGALNTLLGTYAANLLSYIQSHNLGAAQMEDVVGGGVIVPFVSPPGGLRQTSLPYGPSTPNIVTWTGNVPDQYRTTLTVTGALPNWGAYLATNTVTTDTFFGTTFFLDDIYGRALMIDTDLAPGVGNAIFSNTLRLTVDGNMIGTPYTNPAPYTGGFQTARGLAGTLTLALNHPYAAAADGSTSTTGDYMDATVAKPFEAATPVVIVYGLGDTGPGLLAKWSSEKPSDKYFPPLQLPCDPNGGNENCINTKTGGQGDFDREKLSAGYLAQYTRAAHLNAQLANASVQLHHVLGLVYADARWGASYPHPCTGPGTCQGFVNVPAQSVIDSFNRIDVDSGFSLTSRTADVAARRAAVQGVAASAAALEGSIAGQMDDLPDTASTATRFEWGNAPPAYPDYQDPLHPGPRNFLAFTSANASAAASLVVAENQTSSTSDGVAPYGAGSQPVLSGAEVSEWRGALSGAISEYAAAGFSVTASQEAFLGPGQRGGYIDANTYHDSFGHSGIATYSHTPTKQRGGALVATKYDGNGDPIEIAHLTLAMLLDLDGVGTLATKGGGGGVQPTDQATYNPAEAAAVLRSRFADRSNALGVNLSNGSLGYSSPVSLEAGTGGFPYALSASLAWNPGPPPDTKLGGPLIPTRPNAGWVSNWQNQLSLSSSGMEAMGSSDVRASVNTIAAFLAAQDIYKASPGTARDVAAVLVQAWWTHRIEGNEVTAQLGTASRTFLRTTGSNWIAPGAGPVATLVQTGSRVPFEFLCSSGWEWPPYALSRGWDRSGLSFAVTNAGGDTQTFSYWLNEYQLNSFDTGTCGRAEGFRLTGWTFPQGVTITPVYGSLFAEGFSGPYLERIVEIDNSLGRKLVFGWDGPQITSISNGLSGADARSISLSWDAPGFTYGNAVSHTDAMGATTSFRYTPPPVQSATVRPLPYGNLDQVFTADNSSLANLDYDYDSLGRIKQIKDGVAIQQGTRSPYTFYIADGTRGERDDPMGGAYSVVYDTYGHPSRYIDELGRETDATSDGRGRVTSYTYPEQDQEIFAYDDHNNTTSLTRHAKPGSSLSDLVVSATWDTTWNKPLTITNARGVTTTFTYYASGSGTSELHTAVRPADGYGSGTATYSFTYNSIGQPLTATDPDNVVTSNTYDGSHNLTATALDPSHLNIVTGFGYDAQGDVVSTTNPLGSVTTSIYDLDRRKTEDDRHNGNSSAALLAASLNVYDVDGRVTDTKAGTVLSGTTVTTWLTTSHTTYTPTSKVATVTDADGSVVTNTYDGDDRTDTVTDPIGRVVHDTYDAAGETLIEYRGWGSPLSEAYATHAYSLNGKETSVTDALGSAHVTTYTYDGFDRLTRTTYADSSHEDLNYDQDTNVVARANRAGQMLIYAYDNLDRLHTKTIPTANGTAAHSIASVYTLAGRATSLTDSAGPVVATTYDTAGRPITETQTTGGTGRTVTSTLDLAGNRTRLAWPDGFSVDYGYDALNRMSTATQTGGAALAAYAYDTLSRRRGVTYNGGDGLTGGSSAMSYTYSDAGDMRTLTDDLNGTTNDVTFTNTFTAAHQIASETTSNTSYIWAPPTPGALDSTYAAVNNLNQYPSVAGATMTWDANGNLATAAFGSYTHDPENRMVRAIVPGATDSNYAYDPLGRRIVKAVTTAAAPLWGTPNWNGFTWTAAATAVSTTFLHDGANEIAEYDSSGTLSRRFVPGPAVDDYVAMVLAAGTKTFFHTDKMGSIVGMADTSGALAEGPYTYDAYGNCFTSAGASCKTLAATTVPFHFTGQRYDPETNLYYYRARFYCVAIGRFCETDPAGFGPDINRYTYVHNDPMDGTDPMGLDTYGFSVDFNVNAGFVNGIVSGGVVFDDKNGVAFQGTAGGGLQFNLKGVRDFLSAVGSGSRLKILKSVIGLSRGFKGVAEGLTGSFSHSNGWSVDSIQGPFDNRTTEVGLDLGGGHTSFSGTDDAGNAVTGDTYSFGEIDGFVGDSRTQTTTVIHRPTHWGGRSFRNQAPPEKSAWPNKRVCTGSRIPVSRTTPCP